MKVASVLTACSEELADPANAIFSQDMVLAAFNRAVKALLNVRPDENVVRETVTCVAGSMQSIPADSLRLIRVVGIRERNSEQMFRDDPNWQLATPTGEFEFWVFDERNPKRFELYPTASGGEAVNVEVSKVPVDTLIADINTDDVPVNDGYLNPLIHYMKYVLFGKDPTNLASAAKAREALQMFSNELDLKWRIDQMMAEPKDKGTANG